MATSNTTVYVVEPVTPAELNSNLKSVFPAYVVEAFNNLIKSNFRGGVNSFDITQEEAVNEIINVAKSDKYDTKVTRDTIFKSKWLDIEILFAKFGWLVKYDQPGYNETYKGFYTFKPMK